MNGAVPTVRGMALGFRCARTPTGTPPVDAGPPPDAGVPTAPSCEVGGAGRTNCGSAGENCCTSLEVTGGTFYRTYQNDGGGPTGEADPATVSTFMLDKYDVTVGRFRKFRDVVLPPDGGAGWTPPAGSGKHSHLNGGLGLAAYNLDAGVSYEPGWLTADNANIAPTDANLNPTCAGTECPANYPTWTPTPGANENLPINDVNWFEAYAFCIWDGGFLPSQAEGEYAAAGGAEQREFPWGSSDPGTMNQYAIYGCNYDPVPPDAGWCSGGPHVAPVGTATLGAGLWGQVDLSGNMWQWNLDGYSNYPNPCTDCAYLTPTTSSNHLKVLQFGAFEEALSGLYVHPYNGVGGGVPPQARYFMTGFRCARAPAGVVAPHGGLLDTTFAGTGYVARLETGGPSALPVDVGRAVALDYTGNSGGRIVIAGATHGADALSRMAVWRLTPAGAFDSTFGTGGAWILPELPDGGASYVGAQAQGVAVDTMGRPRVVGIVGTVYPQNPLVYGLTANGVLDTTYGQSGMITPAGPTGGHWGSAYSVALDIYQNAIVAGTASAGGVSYLALARFTNAGLADNSFGTGGGSAFAGSAAAGSSDAGSGGRDIVYGLATGSNTIVGVGTSDDPSGRTDLAIWRFNDSNAPGTLDTTFNGTGYEVLSAIAGDTSMTGSDNGQSVAVDAQGRIYFAGYSTTGGGENRGFVGRLTASGSFDASFGTGGLVFFDALPPGDAGYAPSSFAMAVAIDSRNRVVAAGGVNDGYNSYVAAWRLTNAGAVDTSFGVNGRFSMTGTAGSHSDVAQGLAIDAQDRPVIVGSSQSPGGQQAMAVWRLTP